MVAVSFIVTACGSDGFEQDPVDGKKLIAIESSIFAHKAYQHLWEAMDKYNLANENEPRFPVSYETIFSTLDSDNALENVAFTYDIALTLSAFSAVRDCNRGRIIADALLYMQKHDRYFNDGRLKNRYRWNVEQKRWHEDEKSLGSSTGNSAWAMISLLNYYEECGGEQYLVAVATLGKWITTHTKDTRGDGGYTGGYSRRDANLTKLLWKSTEHNLDLYVAFERLYAITKKNSWRQQAQHAQKFVDAMWNQNENEGFYWTGTLDDGVTINGRVIPLDVQTWSVLAFGSNNRTQKAISYAEDYLRRRHGNYEGFAFSANHDMPWPEGTGQAVVAYWTLGDTRQAQFYLNELREFQKNANNGNGKGIVAFPADDLTKESFNRLHIGATAWFIFAEEKYNPYWNTRYIRY